MQPVIETPEELAIKEKLDRLADFQAQKDVIMLARQEIVDTILTPEIKQQIADVDAEFAGKSEAADANITALTAEIKSNLLLLNHSVKATFQHAIYVGGRITWDDRSLVDYAVEHPEILSSVIGAILLYQSERCDQCTE